MFESSKEDRREDKKIREAVARYAKRKQWMNFEHTMEVKNSAGEIMHVSIVAKRLADQN